MWSINRIAVKSTTGASVQLRSVSSEFPQINNILSYLTDFPSALLLSLRIHLLRTTGFVGGRSTFLHLSVRSKAFILAFRTFSHSAPFGDWNDFSMVGLPTCALFLTMYAYLSGFVRYLIGYLYFASQPVLRLFPGAVLLFE